MGVLNELARGPPGLGRQFRGGKLKIPPCDSFLGGGDASKPRWEGLVPTFTYWVIGSSGNTYNYFRRGITVDFHHDTSAGMALRWQLLGGEWGYADKTWWESLVGRENGALRGMGREQMHERSGGGK